jgi:hypothetical protein
VVARVVPAPEDAAQAEAATAAPERSIAIDLVAKKPAVESPQPRGRRWVAFLVAIAVAALVLYALRNHIPQLRSWLSG